MSGVARPVIAIVGRPNVGKSTLFNRYAGRRRALVEDVPGLTRDRIAEEVAVGERRILLVDTAGLDPGAGAALPAAVQQQARAALEGADAILFVVDGQTGIVPLDREIARTLIRGSTPVRLLVNKIDVPAHADRGHEFYGLGLDEPRLVSAEHGRGAWDALEELVATLPAPEPTREEDSGSGLLNVALVGRPNVGKSSLLNRLVGSERVVVSDLPGTTRDSIDIRLESDAGALVLVDTAGLRRSAKRTRMGERGGAFMAVRALDRAQVALVVIDAAAGVKEQDARIAAIALERGCAIAVVANKWDLAKQEEGAGERLRDEIAQKLRFLPDAPLLTTSARFGTRVNRIPAIAQQLGRQASKQLSTADLNRWLQDAVSRHEPAMAQKGSRKRPLRFFYATQTGIQPPTFLLFCTDPAAIRTSYCRYLENRLRERFGYQGTPIRLRLRARRAPKG